MCVWGGVFLRTLLALPVPTDFSETSMLVLAPALKSSLGTKSQFIANLRGHLLKSVPDPRPRKGRGLHSPSSSTASTVAPRLSRACTTEARPFRAAMWSGLGRKERGA